MARELPALIDADGVSVVLDCLAAGMADSDIRDQYPSLPADATRAALAYAAVLAREEPHPLIPLLGEDQSLDEKLPRALP